MPEETDLTSLERVFLNSLYRKGLQVKHMQEIWDNEHKAQQAVAGIIGASRQKDENLERVSAREKALEHFPVILNYFTQSRNITYHELCSLQRARVLARKRHELMYLLRQLTPASLPQIGSFLGDRDHTTVMHGLEAVAGRMKKESGLRERLDTEVLRFRQMFS